MSNRLSGYEAIEYVEAMIEKYDFAEDGAPALSKYADPIGDAREDLTPNEAREIASEDPLVIYFDRR